VCGNPILSSGGSLFKWGTLLGRSQLNHKIKPLNNPRQTTGVHEMGHVLGLGHDYESGCTISIMQADANIVIPCGRQSPGSEDLRGITRIYSQ
jgi:hypothetical protein